MSINWQWKNKIGVIERTNGLIENLYTGSALAIATHEWTKEETTKYTVTWFWLDVNHAKNCLGLSKGYEENSLDDYNIKKIKLNPKFKESFTVASLLIMAKPKGIEISLEEFE